MFQRDKLDRAEELFHEKQALPSSLQPVINMFTGHDAISLPPSQNSYAQMSWVQEEVFISKILTDTELSRPTI